MAYTMHLGDCLEVMRTMPDASVDSVVSDPPYGLSFMGKEWDHGVPGEPFWAEALRVAKPGAMLLAFGGTRTFHRLTCAIEDAGWEIRDVIMWVYGSGFPKSHAIGKAIDKAAGAEREVMGRNPYYCEGRTADPGTYRQGGKNGSANITAPATPEAEQWEGWGTALKPAWEPVIVAMKPIDGTFANNALTHGVAGLNVDGCRVEVDGTRLHRDATAKITPSQFGAMGGSKAIGTTTLGRWPANVIHDGSDEVTGLFPVTTSRPGSTTSKKRNLSFGMSDKQKPPNEYANDTGSAARFFYCAKASRSERTHGGKVDNRHPTVKPLELMRYLCRLTKTPTGGIVLDPFAGSGTTGVAAIMEGRQFVGIEQDEVNYHTAKERIGLTVADMTFGTLLLLQEAAD